MNKKLFFHVLRKTKFAVVVLLLFITVPGLFIQHCLLSVKAAGEKWEFCERFDGDWYSYIGDSKFREADKTHKQIPENARVYTIDEYRVKGDFFVYQYSKNAWTFFDYPMREGDGFMPGKPNSVVVSEGVARRYPVGSTIDLTFSRAPLQHEGTITCEVAGVLKPEEIIFPHNTSSGVLLWNTDDSFSSMTMERKFIVLNPELPTQQMEKCVLRRGMIFDRNSLESEEWMEEYAKSGSFISMKEVYEKSGEERRVSGREKIVGVSLLLVAVIALLVWVFWVMNRCGQDICYLLCVGFSRRKLYGVIIHMAGILLLTAFFLSFAAYVLPNRNEDTWEMSVLAPAAALAGYLVVWAVSSGLTWLLYRNHKFETDMEILFIDDMTLLDNIRFWLLAQGYSAKASVSVAEAMLEKKEIAFCAKRRMDRLGMEQKIWFGQITDGFRNARENGK